jgi:hypothetical protein
MSAQVAEWETAVAWVAWVAWVAEQLDGIAPSQLALMVVVLASWEAEILGVVEVVPLKAGVASLKFVV